MMRKAKHFLFINGSLHAKLVVYVINKCHQMFRVDSFSQRNCTKISLNNPHFLFQPQFAPNYQQSTLNVLIPQNFPGKFYYPPCKCELVNQIRYYNPKTKEFYYHKAYTAMPNPRNLNGKTDRVRLEGSPDGSQYGTHNGVPILAGEPEFYPVPAISTNAATGNHINQHLPAPALALPYMPSNQHYKPYINHHMVCYNY